MALNNTMLPVDAVAADNTGILGGFVGTPAAQTFAGGQLFDKAWCHVIQRTGALPTETLRMDFAVAPPFHHLLDPTTVASQFTLFYENLLQGDVTAGTGRVVCGFWQYVTAGDATTLMGIGFYADGIDNLWHCFVFDSATGAAPFTALYDNATAVLMTSLHRMKIKINGPTRTITWYIDNVLAGTYTPVAALRLVAPTANVFGASVMHGAFCAANATVTVRAMPGGVPMVRIMVAGTPAVVPPATGGTSMSIAVD